MKDLWAYLRQHKKTVFLMILWMGIFQLVFVLSALPLESVLYALLLFLVLCGVFTVRDFQKFRKKQKQLQELKRHIHISIEALPKAETPVEQKYQELIREMFEHQCEMASSYDHHYSEMMDYYTMWVHQVKTPIAAMRLLLQTEETPDKGELQEQLFKVEEYVGMVLQYLRMDGLGSDLKIHQYSLDGIVRQAVRKYSRSFIRKKIRLDYGEIDGIVVTDEKWLLFVVEQILSNAIKYTPEGSISIYMDKVLPRTLVIEDTGIGIAAEDLPRIFEKGFTGYNGRTDKKSTGIGLYLCKKIMEKLNHELRIESEVGKGTRVKLGLKSAELMVD